MQILNKAQKENSYSIATLDSMSKSEFDSRMALGLAQAKADEAEDVSVAFDKIKLELNKYVNE